MYWIVVTQWQVRWVADHFRYKALPGKSRNLPYVVPFDISSVANRKMRSNNLRNHGTRSREWNTFGECRILSS